MTQSIKTYNIANNSIKSFNFDSGINASLTDASNANTNAQAANSVAQSANTLVQSQTLSLSSLPPTINTISFCDSLYNVLNVPGANTMGAYLKVTGSNFQSGIIGMAGYTNTAVSTTLVDSSNVRIQFSPMTEGTYFLHLINSNGGTGIGVNKLPIIPYKLWSWGYNITGELGLNDRAINRSSPTQVGSGTIWNEIVVGRIFGIATKLDGTLWSWGDNSNGKLGLNITSAVNRSSPVQIGTDNNWAKISAGTCVAAIKTDGTLWTWGDNDRGALGQNTASALDRSSPVQVGTDTNWYMVKTRKSTTASYQFMAGIKTDGTLWTWGNANEGQLGDNQILPRSSPTQIGTDTNWSIVDCGDASVYAIKSNGTLWAWGQNVSAGALGLNDKLNRSSPVQVGTDTNWYTISGSGDVALAIKTDGTLWGWGSGGPSLGLNTGISKSSPVQVGALTNWLSVSCGYATAAIKTDGTLWVWGDNAAGQLGLGDRISRSSPVQVGTNTNWNKVFSNISAAVGNSILATTK